MGSWLYGNLKKCGWDEPTPIQRGAIGVMMSVSSAIYRFLESLIGQGGQSGQRR